jgi:DDE superfamily endonuclease
MRVVLDHLNTHKPAALYETFAPADARRLLKTLAVHYTPQHGSWLTMAEMALRLWHRHCLDRRLPDETRLTGEIAASENARNAAHATIAWRFTATKAREKLHRLYPSNAKWRSTRDNPLSLRGTP